MSRSLNSCRTSKRGIADKPQCPSNSFRLQILIAFTIESGKSSAYFILLVLIFLLEQILFYIPHTNKCFKVCPPGKSHEGVCAKHFLPPFPFPALQKYASHRPRSTNRLEFHLTMFHALILHSLNVEKIKTRKLLGDYSSENSGCNRSELRTLEIHFLESV